MNFESRIGMPIQARINKLWVTLGRIESVSGEFICITDPKNSSNEELKLSKEEFTSMLLNNTLRFKEFIVLKSDSGISQPNFSQDNKIKRIINGKWLDWGQIAIIVKNIVILKTSKARHQIFFVDDLESMIKEGFLRLHS